jgi:predicted protein tyrosine phosphatase
MATKFIVTSRQGLRHLEYPSKYVVVSITDPSSKPAYVHRHAGLGAVLRLQFDDVTAEFGPGGKYQAITDDQADKICNFVKKIHPHVDQVIVHCEAGISRSAAVAATLSELIEGKDSITNVIASDGLPQYYPNPLVARKLRAAWNRMLANPEKPLS